MRTNETELGGTSNDASRRVCIGWRNSLLSQASGLHSRISHPRLSGLQSTPICASRYFYIHRSGCTRERGWMRELTSALFPPARQTCPSLSPRAFGCFQLLRGDDGHLVMCPSAHSLRRLEQRTQVLRKVLYAGEGSSRALKSAKASVVTPTQPTSIPSSPTAASTIPPLD